MIVINETIEKSKTRKNLNSPWETAIEIGFQIDENCTIEISSELVKEDLSCILADICTQRNLSEIVLDSLDTMCDGHFNWIRISDIIPGRLNAKVRMTSLPYNKETYLEMLAYDILAAIEKYYNELEEIEEEYEDDIEEDYDEFYDNEEYENDNEFYNEEDEEEYEAGDEDYNIYDDKDFKN